VDTQKSNYLQVRLDILIGNAINKFVVIVPPYKFVLLGPFLHCSI